MLRFMYRKNGRSATGNVRYVSRNVVDKRRICGRIAKFECTSFLMFQRFSFYYFSLKKN